jgi:hypothetical protein
LFCSLKRGWSPQRQKESLANKLAEQMLPEEESLSCSPSLDLPVSTIELSVAKAPCCKEVVFL